MPVEKPATSSGGAEIARGSWLGRFHKVVLSWDCLLLFDYTVLFQNLLFSVPPSLYRFKFHLIRALHKKNGKHGEGLTAMKNTYENFMSTSRFLSPSFLRKLRLRLYKAETKKILMLEGGRLRIHLRVSVLQNIEQEIMKGMIIFEQFKKHGGLEQALTTEVDRFIQECDSRASKSRSFKCTGGFMIDEVPF